MKKFVLDVNAWVSIFYRNKHLRLTDMIDEGSVTILTSEENISEFADIHTKHKKIAKLLPLHTLEYVQAMDEMSGMFEARKRYALLPDYKDNYLIDLAHQSRATLVTNDKHFNFAQKFKSPPIKIISIQEFYRELDF